MEENNPTHLETMAEELASSKEEAQLLRELLASHFQGHLCHEKSEVVQGTFIEEVNEKTKRFEGLIGRWDNLYYLQRSFAVEVMIFDLLQGLLARDVKPLDMRVSSPLNPEQASSVEKALSLPFCALTGGPGTGKTHTIVAILEAFLKQSDEDVVILAPTGKAASVLKKRIFNDMSHLFTPFFDRIEIATLHAYFHLRAHKDPVWEDHDLGGKLCIVDEASMIDTDIWVTLLSAAKNRACLLICGDPYQLPPVEIGSIFAQIVGVLETFDPTHLAALKTSMRTDNKAMLAGAEAVKKGAGIDQIPFEETVCWEEIIQQLPAPFIGEVSAEKIRALFKAMQSFRVLTPLKKGPLGVSGINERVKRALSKEVGEETVWPIPIMVLKNEAGLHLANGDLGFVLKKGNSPHLDDEQELAYFIIEGKVQAYPLYVLPRYEVSYALSVHKSQGSEFGKVLLFLPKGSENFGREVAYTGITRAKESLTLVTDQETLEAVVSKSGVRFSGLFRRFALHNS